MNLKKGFTLIELLVVVAIIGVLASVVLASLNTARGKGANAAIKSNLANMRAQGEIIYDAAATNIYTTFCTDPIIDNQLDAATSALGGTLDVALADVGTTGKVSCHLAADSLSWAVSSGLKVADGTNTIWCVDSTGVSKGGTTVLGVSATVCP
jgi:prepilin-type N-terminal cleavage/methylation domain-containing protein